VYLLGIRSASGQAGPGATPQVAEAAFKNVQVLKGIPVDEFMDTMGMFSAALSLNCSDCHSQASDKSGTWDAFAEDTPLKRTARRMMLMVNALNKDNFGGARFVTCWTCHRGDQRPKVVPSLAVQYSTPLDDPNEVEIPAKGLPGAPSADQVFDTYVESLGGAERLTRLTSFVAAGTYSGYDTDQAKVPVDIFAHAPSQRAVIVHTSLGDSVRTYDGRAGWIAAPDRPLPLMALTGGNLDGAKTEAMLSFPAQLKQAFSPWRVGETTLDDRDVQVLRGTPAGQAPVTLYFDKQSGLLVRLVRLVDTPVGRVPTQIDLADYRDVAGVKLPFRWISTWTNGRSTTQLSEVRPNLPIDPARFGRPAPAPPLTLR